MFSLNGVVYNPHDMYTNLTVRWFKSNDPPTLKGTSETMPEIISDNSSDYIISRFIATTSSTRSCTDGPLYRDTFSLRILNFTTDKNGYYWYQFFVNRSSYQPSQYAWFYADYLCVHSQSHFHHTSEIQCPNATNLMTSSLVMTTTFPINVTMDLMSTVAPKMTETGSYPVYTNATYLITSPLATTATITTNVTMDAMSTLAPRITETGSNIVLNYYVVGALTVLIVLFATLAIIILLLYIRKRHKEHRQKTGESFACQSVLLDGYSLLSRTI